MFVALEFGVPTVEMVMLWEEVDCRALLSGWIVAAASGQHGYPVPWLSAHVPLRLGSQCHVFEILWEVLSCFEWR